MTTATAADLRVLDARGWRAAARIAYGAPDDQPTGLRSVRIEASGRVIATDGTQLLLVNNCVETRNDGAPLHLHPQSNCRTFKTPATLSFGTDDLSDIASLRTPVVRERYTLRPDEFPPYKEITTKGEARKGTYHPRSDFVPLNAKLVAPTLRILEPDLGVTHGWRYVTPNTLLWQHPTYRYYVGTLMEPS